MRHGTRGDPHSKAANRRLMDLGLLDLGGLARLGPDGLGRRTLQIFMELADRGDSRGKLEVARTDRSASQGRCHRLDLSLGEVLVHHGTVSCGDFTTAATAELTPVCLDPCGVLLPANAAQRPHRRKVHERVGIACSQ